MQVEAYFYFACFVVKRYQVLRAVAVLVAAESGVTTRCCWPKANWRQPGEYKQYACTAAGLPLAPAGPK